MVIYSFCVYFSIRLGSIIIGLLTLIQCLVALILFGLWVSSAPGATYDFFDDFLAENDLLYISDTLNRIAKDPSPVRELLLFYTCLHCASCLCLICGAYYMKPGWLQPFLVLEMGRILSLLFVHVTGMLIVKKNFQDLGLLIGLTLLGTFILMYLMYAWFCTYSLYKILCLLSGQIDTSLRMEESLGPPRLYPSYKGYGNLIAPVY